MIRIVQIIIKMSLCVERPFGRGIEESHYRFILLYGILRLRRIKPPSLRMTIEREFANTTKAISSGDGF